jgi:archaellum component FlaC
VEDVLGELKANNIDVRQLVDWPADHCQQAESSDEKKVPNRDSGVGNGKQTSAI